MTTAQTPHDTLTQIAARELEDGRSVIWASRSKPCASAAYDALTQNADVNRVWQYPGMWTIAHQSGGSVCHVHRADAARGRSCDTLILEGVSNVDEYMPSVLGSDDPRVYIAQPGLSCAD